MVINHSIKFLIILGLFVPGVLYAAMSSGNYQVISDSFNAGGGVVDSANYSALTAVGEVAMGESSSALYVLKAGTPAYKASPYVSMSVGSDWIDLGYLSTSAVSYNSHTLAVESNAKSGYVLKIYGNTLMNADGDDINEIGATAAISSPGTEQFGVNLVANTVPLIGAAPNLQKAIIDTDYAIANQFAFTDADTIVTATKHSKDNFTVSYIANIAGGTLAGAYQTTITFSLTSNF